MKGDFTRFTFDPKKHYSGVRMQQGRVLLDSDWNEQADIFDHRSEIEAKDIIGRSGCPIEQAGFNIIQWTEDLTADEQALIIEESPLVEEICNKINDLKPGDFIISAGRYYIDGIVCENERALNYSEQRHEPSLLNDVTSFEMARFQFPYIVYLDVWKRHISVIEDPEIRETALGGPDTTTRVETAWQVRALMPKIEVSNKCIDVSELIPTLSNGRLNVKLSSSTAKSGKCSMAPRGGYQGLENRLYRVEIHDSGQPFGWQKDIQDREGYPYNAGIYGIEYPQPSGDTIHDGKDGLIVVMDWSPDGQSWRPGQMVEIFPLESREKGTLARIEEADHAKMLLKLNLDISKLSTLGQPDLMFHRVATFKWSRDNGSIAYSIEISPDQPKKVKVKSLGRDKSLSLRAGDCVEVLGDTTELRCEPGTMAVISKNGADEANRELTLDQDVSRHKDENNPKIRRWDRSGSSSPEDMVSPITLDEVELDDGIVIRFSKNPGVEYMEVPSFRTGDYWTFPARSIDGKLKKLEDAPAQGIEHHYACLARISVNVTSGNENTTSGDEISFGRRVDCRKFFPSSRDIVNMYYIGGDGQEALPENTLEHPLMVGVAMGRWPVADARVEFIAVSGGGSIEPQKLPDMGYTEKDGVYFAKWTLGKTGAQVAKAFLFDAPGQVGCPVFFHANLSAGSLRCVSGNNQETMPDLTKAVTDSITQEKFIPLAQSVTVQVISNCGPVKNASVKFRTLSGRVSKISDANISKDISVPVDSEGLARCTWYLFLAIDQVGHYRIYQELEASLESFYGINHVDIVPAPSPIRFTARLNAANEISYDPAACPKLETRRGAMTVQDAINSLCPANMLYYVGGDGQDGLPNQVLPQKLQVMVADSRGPVLSSMPVKFTAARGGGKVQEEGDLPWQDIIILTTDGIAECNWILGPSGDQQVETCIIDPSNKNPIPGIMPIRFSANLNLAALVAYTPPKDCLKMDGISDVQSAINSLCPANMLYYVGGDGQDGLPGWTLPLKLQVGVADSRGPVSDVPVKFIAIGGGKTEPSDVTKTRGGIAECYWALGPDGKQQQQVEAHLVDSTGKSIVGSLPVRFSANLNRLAELRHVSSDNQEVMLDLTKPGQPIQVTVQAVNDCGPVVGASVLFCAPIGKADPIDSGMTDKNGIASCKWLLSSDANNPVQVLTATLDESEDYPIHRQKNTVTFKVRLNVASNILYAVSGNGQVGKPGDKLTLKAVVVDSRGPVPGVPVQFKVLPTSVVQPVTVDTRKDGVAAWDWTLGNLPTQQVEASILDSDKKPVGLPVQFNAFLNVADCIGYDPKSYPFMQNYNTVQEALDHLCSDQSDFNITGVQVLAEDGQTMRALDNGAIIRADLLVQGGLTISCSENVDPTSFRVDDLRTPVCMLSIEEPYFSPRTESIIGYHHLALFGDATVTKKAPSRIIWVPSTNAFDLLKTLGYYCSTLTEFKMDRGLILAHLVIKGNFIRSAENPDKYLDGDSFAIRPTISGARSNNLFPSGDGRAGGNFEMWFWISTPMTLNITPISDIKLALNALTKVEAAITVNNPPPIDLVINLSFTNSQPRIIEFLDLPKSIIIKQDEDTASFHFSIKQNDRVPEGTYLTISAVLARWNMIKTQITANFVTIVR